MRYSAVVCDCKKIYHIRRDTDLDVGNTRTCYCIIFFIIFFHLFIIIICAVRAYTYTLLLHYPHRHVRMHYDRRNIIVVLLR